MKITAKIDDDVYLVAMTTTEIAKSAGFSSTYDNRWRKSPIFAGNGIGESHYSRGLKIGLEIKVEAAHDYHVRILDHQGKAQSSAAFLHGLADMISGAVPEIMIPPPIQTPPVESKENADDN